MSGLVHKKGFIFIEAYFSVLEYKGFYRQSNALSLPTMAFVPFSQTEGGCRLHDEVHLESGSTLISRVSEFFEPGIKR